jgi:hypothetical protein
VDMHKQRHYLDYMENTQNDEVLNAVREAIELNEKAGTLNPYKSSPEEFNQMGIRLVELLFKVKEIGAHSVRGEVVPGLEELLDTQSLPAKISGFYVSLRESVDHLASVTADMETEVRRNGRESLNRKLDEARQIDEAGLTEALQEADATGTFTTVEEFFAKHGKTFVPYVAKEVE